MKVSVPNQGNPIISLISGSDHGAGALAIVETGRALSLSQNTNNSQRNTHQPISTLCCKGSRVGAPTNKLGAQRDDGCFLAVFSQKLKVSGAELTAQLQALNL